MNEDDLWTVSDIAEFLDLDASTIRAWVREGRLEPYKKLRGPSGAYLFTEDEVKKLNRRKRCTRCDALVKIKFLTDEGLCASCQLQDPLPVESPDNRTVSGLQSSTGRDEPGDEGDLSIPPSSPGDWRL